MNILLKVFLSFPSIIGLIYFGTFFNNKFFSWTVNNVIGYEYHALIINGLTLIQIGYLILRLWNYKNIEIKIKTEWTVLLVIFNCISSLIFIWKKDVEFQKQNNL